MITKTYQFGFCSLRLRSCGCFVIVVNALLIIARRKSHYATLNLLEQELSAEAATCAVYNGAAACVATGGGIFQNLPKARVSAN
jgi:hypothetical protein